MAGPGRGHSNASAPPTALIHSEASGTPKSEALPLLPTPLRPAFLSPNPEKQASPSSPRQESQEGLPFCQHGFNGPAGRGRFGPQPISPQPPPGRGPFFPSFAAAGPPLQPGTSQAQGLLRHQSPGGAGSNLQVSSLASKRASHRINSERAREEPPASCVRSDFVFCFPRPTPLAGSGNVPGGLSHPREPSSKMGP